MSTTGLKYDSGLPADSETTVLYDSSTGDVRNLPQKSGLRFFVASINNDQDGELIGYWSDDGGATWVAHYSSGTLSAPAAGSTNDIEVNIEAYRDWRISWVNGGTTQTTFQVQMVLTYDSAGF